MLRTAGAVLAGLAGPRWRRRPPRRMPARRRIRHARQGPLGARLQGVQHFGLTVQNMDRAYEFYTEVLGGTEVMRDGDFQGERIHNTLLADQEIEARARRSIRARSACRTSPAASSGSTCASCSSTMW